MKRTKRFAAACLSLLLALAVCILPASAAEDAPALRFKNDGTFTILHLTDTQDDQHPARELKPFLEKAIETAQPDLIVFTGDLVEDTRQGDFKDDFGVWEGVKVPGNKEKTRQNAFQAADFVLSIFENSGVPFALTQGNNDYKVGVDNAEWAAFYGNYAHCLTADMSEDSAGIDYRLPILAADGSDVKLNVYCMDSGTKLASPKSVEWYAADSAAQQAQSGKAVPAFVFQHIPVDEISRLFVRCEKGDPDGVLIADFDAFRRYKLADTAHGYFSTVYHSETGESYEFTAWKQQGDVIAAFFGHMHQDGFSGVYDGMELNMTYGCEFAKEGPYGMRVITLHEDDVTQYDNQIYSYQDGSFVPDPYRAPVKTLSQKTAMFFDSLFYVLKTMLRKVLPL